MRNIIRVARQLRFLVCLLLCAAVASARAQSAAESITLEWSAPAGCPDGETVRALLWQRLPAQQASASLHARARVTQESHDFRLELELAADDQAAPAKRSLRNTRCEPLAEAAVVLIGLALSAREPTLADPAAPAEASSSEANLQPMAATATAAHASPSARGADKQPPAEPQDTTVQAEASSGSELRGPSRPLHLQLSAAARTAVGLFPQDFALALQAQLAVRSAPLYAALGFSYWFPSEARAASYPRARLKGSGMFADVSLGADMTLASLVLTPALCLELGRLDAQALGVNGPEARHAVWLAAGAALSLSFTLFRSWFVAIDAAGLSPLTRIRWLVRAPGSDVQAFLAAPFAARISVRMGYTFW